jgi:hypothetical protein
VELATWAATDSRKPAANAISIGSLSMKGCRSHPETHALLLAMPREVAAVGAAPPRIHRSLLLRKGADRGSVKSTRTAITGQSGGKTALLGAVHATKRDGSSLGSPTQSTTLSAKWLVSGHTSCHHWADSQRGIIIVANPFCPLSDIHTLPIKL